MSEQFLSKTNIERSHLLMIGGAPAIDGYPALRAALARHAGDETAALFAEPILSRGNDVAQPTVSWYTATPGEAKPLSELTGELQKRAEDRLRGQLASATAALSDPEYGPLVGSAFHIADKNDIWVVDGQPVITNWGISPLGNTATRSERTTHFVSALGAYMSVAEAPPINAKEQRARNATLAAGAAVGAGAGLAMASSSANAASEVIDPNASMRNEAIGDNVADAPGGHQPTDGAPVAVAPVSGWVFWTPIVVVLLLAAGVLFWLLQPDTRLFPPKAPAVVAVVTDEQAKDIDEEIAASLRERIKEVEAALTGGVCTAEGEFILPGGRLPEGVLPRAGNSGEGTEGVAGADGPAEASPSALLPPNPQDVEIARPPESDPAQAGNKRVERSIISLRQVIDEQTVLVIANSENSGGTGSGFFIAPDLVVTNHHVVTGASEIFVTNGALGGARAAELLKSLGPLESAGADFALLRISGVNPPFYTLRDSTDTMKLQNVIAAGYPGAILETDAAFQALLGGDATAIPSVAVTDGIVNTEQEFSPTTRVLVHTARISPGNSGGPLLDYCGRVIGVNTFGRTSDSRHLNFSLASTDLLRFLDGAAAVRSETQACAPAVAAAASVTPQPADPKETVPQPEPAE